VVSSTPENYKRINGLNMGIVQKNIIDLHELKEENGFHTRITNRIIVCEENQHELSRMKRVWKPFCDDIHVVHEFTVPEKDRGVVNKPRVNCLLQRKLYRTGVVKWDGNVVPCCTDMDGRNIFGNVYHQTFKNIFHGKRFEEYREKVVSDTMPEICGYCSIAPSLHFRRMWRKIYG
jgi:radical SAM protein with 4Fe4S-binding SPASM domain